MQENIHTKEGYCLSSQLLPTSVQALRFEVPRGNSSELGVVISRDPKAYFWTFETKNFTLGVVLSPLPFDGKKFPGFN